MITILKLFLFNFLLIALHLKTKIILIHIYNTFTVPCQKSKTVSFASSIVKETAVFSALSIFAVKLICWIALGSISIAYCLLELLVYLFTWITCLLVYLFTCLLVYLFTWITCLLELLVYLFTWITCLLEFIAIFKVRTFIYSKDNLINNQLYNNLLDQYQLF